MKRFVAFIACILCGAALFLTDGATVLALSYPDALVTAYKDGGVTLSGDAMLLTKKAKSYTVKLQKNQAARVLELLRATVVSDQPVAGNRVIEARSQQLDRFFALNGGAVTLQIAEREDDTLVGIPSIVGSY